MSRTLAGAAVLACLLGGQPAPLPAQEPDVVARLQPDPEPQDEFVPIDELPPEEQLAAAPLLVGAYAFVLVALFTYVTHVARRLTGLQRDLARLEATIGRDGKG